MPNINKSGVEGGGRSGRLQNVSNLFIFFFTPWMTGACWDTTVAPLYSTSGQGDEHGVEYYQTVSTRPLWRWWVNSAWDPSISPRRNSSLLFNVQEEGSPRVPKSRIHNCGGNSIEKKSVSSKLLWLFPLPSHRGIWMSTHSLEASLGHGCVWRRTRETQVNSYRSANCMVDGNQQR